MLSRVTPLLTALIVCAGCAGSSKKGDQPSWRARDAGATPVEAAPQQIVFAPQGDAVTRYNDPPFAAPVSTPIGDAIVNQVAQLSEQLGKAPPTPDGRLYSAARDLAEVSPEKGTVAYPMVEFAMQRHGIIEPSPHLVVMRGSDADRDAVLRELGERLTTILAENDFARIGVGTANRGPDDTVIVLAMQSSAIETNPIPRSVPAGGKASVSGRIQTPFVDPHVYVTRSSGDVETVPMQRKASGEFASTIECGDHLGKQQIEITASDSSGSTVLANFPMWCGESPPPSITVDVTDDAAAHFADAGEAESAMIEMLNRDRAAHQLPPLVIDPRVAAVARAHSQDMLETGVVGHISPNTGNASDRVKAGNIRTAVVLENVARAYSLTEAQGGLMNSPGHRANLLSNQATHVGVGIVLGKSVADRREMFVTQVFIRIPSPINRDKVVAAVVDSIRAIRPIAFDPKLGGVAGPFAAALAAGTPTKTAAARASESLHKLNLTYRGVTTLATTVADVAAFDASSALTDRTITHFGVGVAQGEHPELGEGAISIVVLFAHN